MIERQSPFVDPHPIGEPGYSVYEFRELKRYPSPCGKFVPQFILVRLTGPFPTMTEANNARRYPGYANLALRLLPDRGRIWGYDTEDAERSEGLPESEAGHE